MWWLLGIIFLVFVAWAITKGINDARGGDQEDFAKTAALVAGAIIAIPVLFMWLVA